MSTKIDTVTNRVTSIDTKRIARVIGVLFLYCLAYFLSFVAFSAMGRRGTMGSLLLFVIVIGAAMTAIHYFLMSRGW